MSYNNIYKTGQIFIVSSLIILCSCKCKQAGSSAVKSETDLSKKENPMGSNTPVAQDPAGNAIKDSSLTKKAVLAAQEPYRLIVSFISIGSGINLAAREKLENHLQLNELLKMKNPEIERNPWGREGEVDFCMKLSAFTPAEQEKLLKVFVSN